MNVKLQIKVCPTCGSDLIERVVRDVTRKYKKQTYTVPSVEFYDCPNCGEKVYDREAMLKIEAYSPAYRKARVVARDKSHITTAGMKDHPASG
jgi:YgiT-type zinc finger domain-containing protein